MSFTLTTVETALSNATTVVSDAIGSVVNMIGSNTYLSIGFGLGLLGLGIAFVRKIRRV